MNTLQVGLRRAHADVSTCHDGLWSARNIQFSDSLADESHIFRTSHDRRYPKSHMFRSTRKSLVDFMGSLQLGCDGRAAVSPRQRNHRPETG
ncbi:hypothetical protein D9M68_916810 [compost metagenome]